MAKVVVLQSAPNKVTVTPTYTAVSVETPAEVTSTVAITELNTFVTVQDAGGALDLPQHYSHTQNEPSTTWEIYHGLNTRPSVDVVNDEGISVFPTITYIGLNSVTITFSSLQKGSAYFN